MKTIFTIGFTKKTAEEFFTLLEENSVSEVVDVRRHNTSQLAGFTKPKDLRFFLNRICNISYRHDKNLSPNLKLLRAYRKNEIDWLEYEIQFLTLMEELNSTDYILKNFSDADRICFLCSEPTPETCHRRIVAELFQAVFRENEDVEIIHL